MEIIPFSDMGYRFNEIIDYQDGSVVSRQLIKKAAGNVTLFSFDKDEGLSEHTAPFDALVYITDGKGEITIDKKIHNLSTDEMIIMPANIPHALFARERFKMILIMIKSE
ncbi:MAG: cupin domain-containing protein [Candidatus Heimdallarchaeota archaeon]